MAQGNRDNFTEKARLQIAKRAGWLCSDPSCRRPTVGSNSDGSAEIDLGIAAHICAAASGGPRYDPNMTREQRRSADNGIWMCNLHGKAVDAKDSTYTVELLQEWKAQAQKDSWRRVLYDDRSPGPVTPPPSEDELSTRLRAAAAADLDVFRRSSKWPSTAIPLTLEVGGLSDPVSTSTLATALVTLGDLILVAPPGTGKTTTLFQIAEAVRANGNASPIVVPLGEWSTDGASLLESVLKRPTFREISEDDFRAVAAKPGVVLLLDGWNEFDSTARRRAAAQIERLQMELPELSLLISTRKQALDVPIDGTRLSLLPLNETEQLDIARALRGDAGERIVDQAWRTAGVRELVTIPLYLTALLTLPEGTPFPTTKQEVLRRFVAAHEQDYQHHEALSEVMHGCHQRFLEGLAVTATRVANTTISEAVSRRSVSETEDALVAEGQITDKIQPNIILEALGSHHVLVRGGNSAGYSFQHQQFQEWYASHFVERLMLASIRDDEFRERLKADVLNLPAWEEAILFACERLARGINHEKEACGAAIIAAFEVDPILAAEMIYRSTDDVWTHVRSKILNFVTRWHSPGKVDRAFRFMMISGRPEFFDQVWPLITHENDQVHLEALRAGTRFRPCILGNGAAHRLAALPKEIRRNVLHEIAFNSGMDGLNLAATVAMADPDAEVKAAVVDAFAFRRADRHVAEVLRGADENTYDLVARKNLVDGVKDETIKSELAAACERLREKGLSIYDRMRTIVFAHGNEDLSAELVTLIAEIEIGKEQEGTVRLIYEAHRRYPQAVADGILRRLREGHPVPFRAARLMAGSDYALEENALLEIALDGSGFDDRANVAASVLGPQAVGHMIHTLLEVKELIRNDAGKYHKAAVDRYHTIRGRIGNTQTTHLLAAIAARSANADDHEIAELANLISSHVSDDFGHSQPLASDARAVIAGFAVDWGNRLLDSPGATRAQLASIAKLVSVAQSPRLLPLLKRLLDEEFSRWRAFKEQARANQYRPSTAADEARTSWILLYQRAFYAIGSQETAALMREYLPNEDFGRSAAIVLAEQWRAAYEPRDDKIWPSGPDFSRVAEKRAARAADPTVSSTEADAIFNAIESLIRADTTKATKRHAVALAVVAAALPHGQRYETISMLIAIADRYPRNALLRNLILSGEIIDIELIKQGIAEVFEAAETQPWILTDREEHKDWLRLLPFTNRPIGAFDVVRTLPERWRSPNELEELLDALEQAPGKEAETTLFQLAEADPRFYANYDWCEAVLNRGTLSAATRLVDLVAQDVFSEKGGMGEWSMSQRIAGLVDDHTELRAHVYDLLKNGPISPGGELLAQAISWHPDTEGLLLLIRFEIEYGCCFASWYSIENVVMQEIQADDRGDTQYIMPAPAGELRQKLLAMTTDGGANDVAARWLAFVDNIRDEHGRPESEPRHPDLASGKPWPIIMHGSNSSK